MKRRLIVLLSLALVAVLALTGCSGDKYKAIKINGAQDYNYVVTGNGTSAVKFGNYVYFINGTRGFEDSEGESNVFGEVVKGALYRAELNGSKDGNTFVSELDANSHIRLVSSETTNYKNEKAHDVKVQLVAPKTIGTSGYSDGGIFIYDNYVYYASPCNTENKQGKVMSKYTSFFREKLDGSKTELIYTSASENDSLPYAFYKFNGNIYLVLEETDEDEKNIIKSVKVRDNGKVDIKTIATGVQNAVFSANPTYYNGISTDTVYDYIYVTYAANEYYEDQPNRTGNILEYLRPDGSDAKQFQEGNTTLDYVAVRDNVVFYKNELYADTVLAARDYQSMFGEGGMYVENILSSTALTEAQSVYPFAAGIGSVDSNRIQVLTVSSVDSSVALALKTPGVAELENIDTATTSITVQRVTEEYVYYIAVSDSMTTLKAYNRNTKEVKTVAENVTTGLKVGVVDTMVVYFGTIDDKFDGYTLFYDNAGIVGNDTYFVGKRLAGDERSNVESVIIEEGSLADVKEQYEIGEKLDVSGLKLVLTYYAKDGVKETKTVNVEKDWVSGFDSSSAIDSQTLTITYKDKADSFTATYIVTIVE